MTRVAFATIGCRVNQVDTQEQQGRLEAEGYRTVPFTDAADVVVVNTCAVTARAELSDRQMIRRAVRAHPAARIVVTGCWAQTAPWAIAAIPGVDLVVGVADRHRLSALIDGLERGKTARPMPASVAPKSAGADSPSAECNSAPLPIHVTDVRVGGSMEPAPLARVWGRSRAFLKIQDGCQHRCAFCIVPYARGPSRSREPNAVLDQARALVEEGHPEIVLTGVDLGHYGADLTPRASLAALLRKLDGIRGLRWIRLSSVLPAYFTPDLLEAITGMRAFAPHLHVPLQSGSDRLLRRMRRPYTIGSYTRLIERLAEALRAPGLGTDLIAGFPGETDEDAAATEALVAALPFSYLHVFSYSDRPGTEAVRFQDHVPTRVVATRSRRLRELGETKARAFGGRMRGTCQEVLVLGTRDRTSDRLVGLTGNYVEVLFHGADALMGRIVSVRVTAVERRAVEGELVA